MPSKPNIVNRMVKTIPIIGGTVLLMIMVCIAVISISSTSLGTSPSDHETTLSKNAKRVAKYAKIYYDKKGDYPKMISDFNEYDETTIPDDIKIYSNMLLTNTSLTYIYCGQNAAQIVYLGGNSHEVKQITALGTAATTEICPKTF